MVTDECLPHPLYKARRPLLLGAVVGPARPHRLVAAGSGWPTSCRGSSGQRGTPRIEWCWPPTHKGSRRIHHCQQLSGSAPQVQRRMGSRLVRQIAERRLAKICSLTLNEQEQRFTELDVARSTKASLPRRLKPQPAQSPRASSDRVQRLSTPCVRQPSPLPSVDPHSPDPHPHKPVLAGPAAPSAMTPPLQPPSAG